MAVGNGPAPGVYLLHVGLELVGPGEDDAGEGLVYLDPVHIVDAQPCLFEYQARGRYDAGQLHDRVLADGNAGHEASLRHKAVGLRLLAVPNQHGRGAVGELGGVARRYDTVALGPEDCLSTRHLFGVYVVADALVRRELYLVVFSVEAGCRQDLLVLALVGRHTRPPVALGREGVQVLTRDPPPLRDPLRALALVDQLPLLQKVGVHLVARDAVAGVAEHRGAGHALYAGGDSVAYVAHAYRLGSEMCRLLAGAAHAVEANRRDGHGEAREHHAEPSYVRPLLAGLGNGAVYHVFDLLRIEPRALQKPVEGMRQKGVGAHLTEGPAGFGERGAHRLEDYWLSHLRHDLSSPLVEVHLLSDTNAVSSPSASSFRSMPLTAASGRSRSAAHSSHCLAVFVSKIRSRSRRSSPFTPSSCNNRSQKCNSSAANASWPSRVWYNP